VKHLRTKLTGIILGLAGTLVASLGFYEGMYGRYERLTTDFRFRQFNTSISENPQICIIGIDDESLATIGDWPWPRTHLAKIINFLNELESRQILVDLVFSMAKSEVKPENPEVPEGEELGEDDTLAQACREQGRVILASYFAPSPPRSALYDLLVSNIKLNPEDLAGKSGWPLRKVQLEFVSTRRLAIRKLVTDLLVRRPKLQKDEVVVNLLGSGWLGRRELQIEIAQAYDYIQAYQEVRDKTGWMVEGLVRPIEVVSSSRQMVVPIRKLAASSADIGFVDFEPDPEGKVREIRLLKNYEDRIYRQLALAGGCHYLGIEPGNFRIGTGTVNLLTPNGADKGNVLIKGAVTPGLQIPLTREGRMIINWYSPRPDPREARRWEKSFKNIIPAARILLLASNQESLRKKRWLFANAMPIAVKELLSPRQYERYSKLTKLLPLLHDSVDDVLPGTEKGRPTTTTSAPATKPATRPTTTSAPATTVEQDLVLNYRDTRAELDKIEAEVQDQVDWLYGQLDQLPPSEQTSDRNLLIRELWRCLNRPEEVRRANDQQEAQISRKVEELTPLVRNKVVLIGSTAAGLGDFVSTPVFDLPCPGVLVHANILNQILQNSFFSESDRNSDLLVILIIGTLVSILSAQRPAFEGLLWMLLILIGFILLTCYVVFGKLHVVSSLVGPVLAIVLSWSLVSFYRQLTERRAKRIFAGRLSQYTSASLARKIADHPEGLEILPEQREVTCYFSDLAGFTPVSEKLGPQKTVEFLNVYLEHMSEILDTQEAFINKFQGDGIFAFFNPPLHPQPDHARRACLAAIESQILLPHIQEHLVKQGFDLKDPLIMRVGISTGPAVVGDCGSARKFDYTCLGDTVNRASRLETANKFFGTGILLCENTFREMGDDLMARLLGKVRVVGREQALVVYELIGLKKDHADRAGFASAFENMVLDYWEKRFTKVGQALTALEQMKPDDKSVKIYRDLVTKITKSGPQHFRDGVIEFESK
jgi:class 3 adenylate cyclase/CHASE2 domain-containing sensor protein